MRVLRRLGLALAGTVLAVAAVSRLHADTVSVAADAQTNANQPEMRFGLAPAMSVRQRPIGSIAKSHARFDLSELPPPPTSRRPSFACGWRTWSRPAPSRWSPSPSPGRRPPSGVIGPGSRGHGRLLRRGRRPRAALHRGGHHGSGPGLGVGRPRQPRPGIARRGVGRGQRGLQHEGEHREQPSARAGAGARRCRPARFTRPRGI